MKRMVIFCLAGWLLMGLLGCKQDKSAVEQTSQKTEVPAAEPATPENAPAREQVVVTANASQALLEKNSSLVQAVPAREAVVDHNATKQEPVSCHTQGWWTRPPAFVLFFPPGKGFHC